MLILILILILIHQDPKKQVKQDEDPEDRSLLTTPSPVDIASLGEEYDMGEISSSSEIEVGESSRSSEVENFLDRCQGETFAPSLHRNCR